MSCLTNAVLWVFGTQMPIARLAVRRCNESGCLPVVQYLLITHNVTFWSNQTWRLRESACWVNPRWKSVCHILYVTASQERRFDLSRLTACAGFILGTWCNYIVRKITKNGTCFEWWTGTILHFPKSAMNCSSDVAFSRSRMAMLCRKGRSSQQSISPSTRLSKGEWARCRHHYHFGRKMVCAGCTHMKGLPPKLPSALGHCAETFQTQTHASSWNGTKINLYRSHPSWTIYWRGRWILHQVLTPL